MSPSCGWAGVFMGGFFPLQVSTEVGLNVQIWLYSLDFLKLPLSIWILIKIFRVYFPSPGFFPNSLCSTILISGNVMFACPTCSPLPFLSCNTTRPLSWLLLPTSYSFILSLHRTLISRWKLFWYASSSWFFFLLHPLLPNMLPSVILLLFPSSLHAVLKESYIYIYLTHLFLLLLFSPRFCLISSFL